MFHVERDATPGHVRALSFVRHGAPMLIRRLQVQDLRRLAEVELRPAPGFNLITGDNGSGKTSLLEAMHLMAHGRSFRGRVRDGLIRSGAPALQVFVEWRAAGTRQPARGTAPFRQRAGRLAWTVARSATSVSCARHWRSSPSNRAAMR